MMDQDTKVISEAYQRTVEEILSIPKFASEKHDHSVRQTYLAARGHPEKGIRVIHVAGTNGKGSVCRMLADMLRLSGQRVGEFYSPHLIRLNERIRVDQREIPDEDVTTFYGLYEKVRLEQKLPRLTFFEVLFVLAMPYFRKEQVQDAVLETGMGGRLDATNSIPAALYVITEIGMDHEEYLGDTIQKIAAEKAGIITGSSPVVFHTGYFGGKNERGESPADTVIQARATEMRCGSVINCNKIEVLSKEVTAVGIDFSFRNDYDKYDHVFLPTHALYQIDNAVTAITAIPYLCPDKDREEIRRLVLESLQGFLWEGRMEQVCPGVFTDGAHNPSAARQLAASVKRLAEQEGSSRLQLIFGVSGDKNISSVFRELAAVRWDRVILTCYQGSRSASPEKLLGMAGEIFTQDTRIETAADLESALKKAGVKAADVEDAARERTLTIVTGSLYLVGELKNMELDYD